MTIGDFLMRLRNPKETAKTAVVAIVFATLSIVGTQTATGLWTVVVSRLEFPMERAEIESIRRDLASTPCQSIAMLVAQIAADNKTIEHNQESNRHWYSDWAVTDQWNAIQRLEIPCQKQ